MTTPDPLMSLSLITAPPETRSGQQHYEASRAPGGDLPGARPMRRDWGDIGDDDRANWEERAREWNLKVGAVGIGPTDPSTGMAVDYCLSGKIAYLHLERPAETQPGKPMVGIGLTDPETGVALEHHADGEVTRWEPTTGDPEVAPDGS